VGAKCTSPVRELGEPWNPLPNDFKPVYHLLHRCKTHSWDRAVALRRSRQATTGRHGKTKIRDSVVLLISLNSKATSSNKVAGLPAIRTEEGINSNRVDINSSRVAISSSSRVAVSSSSSNRVDNNSSRADTSSNRVGTNGSNREGAASDLPTIITIASSLLHTSRHRSKDSISAPILSSLLALRSNTGREMGSLVRINHRQEPMLIPMS
jgi:hypothetical protein